MQVLICLAVLVAAVAAECPVPTVTTPLLVSNFSGVWYQWASYGSFIFQGDGNCAKSEYTLNLDTNTLDVNNTQLAGLVGYVEVDGSAQLKDNVTLAGVLEVTLQTLVGEKTNELSVLSTDYDTFAILWNCKSGWWWDSAASWILTRDRVPDSTVIDAILKALGNISSESFALSIVDYDDTYQGDDCEN